jgi:signal transduction histidine kinase/DNA-binding NarL/FixJ family response regulator
MKTLLVLSQLPELAETIRTGLNPEQYRVIHRAGLEEAEPLLAHGLANACILDMELTGVQGIWVLEKLRRRDAKCPVIVFTGAKQSEWEEEAYLQGVMHVLAKPVRIRMLTALLDRLWAAAPRVLPAPLPFLPAEVSQLAERASSGFPAAAQTLRVLRDFSSILTHSLNAEAMLKQFLLLLREILSINRAAIFLRQPYASIGSVSVPEESRRLCSACAIGLSAGLLQHFELSVEAGIGGQLLRLGRILRRNSDEAQTDIEAQKEFELLGAQVAVPMLDRETLIGVAVFDGRVTGEPLVNAELELIFHLLEQVGLAVRNIWLHDQLASNHEMMAGVLRELSSACIVVNRDLKILHANKMARRHFGQTNRPSGEMEFTDLPQPVGAKVYQVLRTGTAVAPFKYESENARGTIYNVTVVPFQRQDSTQPVSALLTVEDLTQSEQFRRLEIEASNLRLVKTMADRLTHEIGNAMVPLSTHQQLLADKYKDPEFRASLDSALADGVRRVTRLINQMRFLARDAVLSSEAFPLSPLIEEAYQEARKHQPVKAAQLKYESGGKPVIVTGDRAALKHALTEVMINALQANPADSRIGVHFQLEPITADRQGLQIEVQDNGSGFTPETAQKAASPFFTTRNVGLGLGLAVSRKIVETHHGKLEIIPPESGRAGVVRISLPVEQSQPSNT